MGELPSMSRREREVMDILHELQQGTAAQIQKRMDAPPSNGAIRSVLRILVQKGHLRVEQDGPRYVYSPTEPLGDARRSAVGHLLHTFFGGSVQGVIATLLEDTKLTEEEQVRIKTMIDQAAKEDPR